LNNENIDGPSLRNGGTCLDPSTFSTSTAGTRIEYVRDPQPDGTGHGQFEVSLRLTKSSQAADQQLAALQSLTAACADELGRNDVPGAVTDSSTQPRPLTLPLPSASFRTVAHFPFQGNTLTYFVDLIYMTAGRARVVVGFFDCCQPIDENFQTTILNDVASELQTIASK